MKRIAIMGVCLAAVLGLAAVAASSALAAQPEYFTCVKAKGGTYQKSCSSSKEGGEGGGYKREPVKTPSKFTDKSGLSVFTAFVPGTGIAGEVKCAKSTSKGAIISSTQAEDKIVYEKCESSSVTCTSTQAGEKPGDITTNALLTTLVGTSEARSGVGVLVEAKSGGNLAEFNCGASKFETKGSVTGEETENVEVASKHWGNVFEVNVSGEPTIATGGSKTTLLAAITEGSNTNTLPSGENTDAAITGAEIGATNGIPPEEGSVVGTVTSAGSPPTAVQGAIVAVCKVGGGICYEANSSGSSGSYEAVEVTPGSYLATVYPPVGAGMEQTSAEFKVVNGSATTVSFILTKPKPVPPGTKVSGKKGEEEVEGVKGPLINWMEEAPISTEACVGGTVTATITATNTTNGKVESRSVTLVEHPSGSGIYEGLLPAVYPLHGVATITIARSGCANSNEDGESEFTAYIDPSGKVVDGNNGDAPVVGATVELLSSPSLFGTYTLVPNGSAVMSPVNRVDPDTTDGEGMFGWDTAPGFYEVRAEKAGCGSTTSAAFYVPPPVTELELVLHCEAPLHVTTSSLPEATPGVHYEAQLAASGGDEPYKWKSKGALPKGLKLSAKGLLSGTPSATPGSYPIKVIVTDSSKPAKSAEATLTLVVN
jgi:hypothetical protein